MQPQTKCPKFNSLVKTQTGYLIYNPNDINVGKSFNLYGEWSGEEVEILLDLTKDDSIVLDIGANIGALTIPIAMKAKQVLSFECQQYVYYMLCGNIALNSILNVRPFHNAVGKEIKGINIPNLDQTEGNNISGLSLVGLHGLPLPVSTGEDIPTAMITIDSLNLDKCDLMKLDVEGMEFDVIEGATKTIKKFKPIIYTEADRPKNRDQFLEYIENLGYELWEHMPPLFRYRNFKNNPRNEFGNAGSLNILCMPKGRENELPDINVYNLKRVEKM